MYKEDTRLILTMSYIWARMIVKQARGSGTQLVIKVSLC